MLDVVRSLGADVHGTTREILAKARERRPTLGYSTVYRALLRLRDAGLIAEVNIPGLASAVYESTVEDHAHFHCQRCGRLEDVGHAVSPAELAAVAKVERIVTGAALTFRGLCPACAASERR